MHNLNPSRTLFAKKTHKSPKMHPENPQKSQPRFLRPSAEHPISNFPPIDIEKHENMLACWRPRDIRGGRIRAPTARWPRSKMLFMQIKQTCVSISRDWGIYLSVTARINYSAARQPSASPAKFPNWNRDCQHNKRRIDV